MGLDSLYRYRPGYVDRILTDFLHLLLRLLTAAWHFFDIKVRSKLVRNGINSRHTSGIVGCRIQAEAS